MAGNGTKFEILNSANGEFFFRFKAANGETMVSSETYKAKASAQHAIDVFRRNAAGADVVDLTK